jgi:hypothetical protein
VEARSILASGETFSQYEQYLESEFGPFYSERVTIVTAEGRYIAGGVDNAGGYEAVKAAGSGIWRNAATMLTAKLAAGSPNESPGWVAKMRSLTLSEIRHWKDGYQDYMDALNTMRLTVLKEYNNWPGIYIMSGRIKSAPNSDFSEIPERRRADKMHRIVYQESMPFVDADSETESSSGGFDTLKAFAMAAVSRDMMQPGAREISGATIVVDPNKNFATSNPKKLQLKLGMQIKPRAKFIEWTTNYTVVTK